MFRLDRTMTGDLENEAAIIRDFLSSIGTQARAPLEALSTDTILEFKQRWLSGGRSRRTVNQTIKILKRPFKIALDEGLIDRNPVAVVRPIRASSAKKGVLAQSRSSERQRILRMRSQLLGHYIRESSTPILWGVFRQLDDRLTRYNPLVLKLFPDPATGRASERCSSNFFGRVKLMKLSGPSRRFIWSRLFRANGH
jgi:hypothetical protein